MSSSFVSIGIDVSKDRLDIHMPQGCLSIDNTIVAIEKWLSTLKGVKVEIALCARRLEAMKKLFCKPAWQNLFPYV